MARLKKRLSAQQEFEIMKIVLDKFLLVGVVIMLIGMWQMFTFSIPVGLAWMAVGAIMLILFTILIVKEYEVIK
jgi:hypothetical protein